MARFLIDISRLLYHRVAGRIPTGIDRVSLRYVAHYAERSHAVLSLGNVSGVLTAADSRRAFRLLLDGQADARRLSTLLAVKSFPLGMGARSAANAWLFNTGHSGLEAQAYARKLRAARVRPVFLVHDLIPLTHAEYCRPGAHARHERRMLNALRFGHALFTVSRDTLGVLERFASEHSVPMPPAAVAPIGPGIDDTPPGEPPMEGPYFVIVGTIEPRKNHWMLLQIWRRLVERLGAGAPRLVVIGQRGWECENVVDLLERCRELSGVVIERNRCTDAELVTYLHHARALLFPSFAEGYGLPLVEALRLKVPVVASGLPVFREIAGEIPDYLDPLDGMGWMDRILDYAQPQSRMRLAQLARIFRHRPPTWEQHFRIVDDVLGELDRKAAT